MKLKKTYHCKRYLWIKNKLIKSGFKIQTRAGYKNKIEILKLKKYKLYYSYSDTYCEFYTDNQCISIGFLIYRSNWNYLLNLLKKELRI